MLYQVWSLVRTVQEACAPDSAIRLEDVQAQADEMVVNAFLILHDAPTEGAEREIIRRLVRLREILSQGSDSVALYDDAQAVSAELGEVVNEYFYTRLAAFPGVVGYLEGIEREG
jgi:hypothetical protein